MDGRGVPLSLIVTGANRHDVSQLAAVLEAIVVKQPLPPKRRSKHLCAGAGYTGAPALAIIAKHGLPIRPPKEPAGIVSMHRGWVWLVFFMAASLLLFESFDYAQREAQEMRPKGECIKLWAFLPCQDSHGPHHP